MTRRGCVPRPMPFPPSEAEGLSSFRLGLWPERRPGPDYPSGIHRLHLQRRSAQLWIIVARIICLAWLALALCVQASVTVAWRLPAHSSVASSSEHPEATQLREPPSASVFFEEGDELWEISKTIWWGDVRDKESAPDPFNASEETGPWKGEWIVWNRRSGMVVARGSWSELRRLESKLSLNSHPMIQRIKVELVTISERDEPLVSERSIAVFARCGEEVKGCMEGIQLKMTSDAYRPAAVSSNTMALSWPSSEKDSTWQLDFAFSAFDGVRTRIAKGKDGDDRWEIYVTVSAENVDGTPVNEDRWIESPQGAVVWAHCSPSRSFQKDIPGDLVMGAYPVPDDFVLMLGGSETEAPSFVDSPSSIAAQIRGPFIDVRGLLGENGVKLIDPKEFAGFDTRSLTLVTVSNREARDTVEAIVSGGLRDLDLGTWVETNSESGGWGLLCRSGEISSIFRRQGGEQVPACVFELTVGSNRQVMDLRYRFDVVRGSERLGHLEAASTLLRARPQEIGSYTANISGEIKVVVTAGSDQR